MSKEKYKIHEKSIWISLTIIESDLRFFDVELSAEKRSLTDLIRWLRSTLNVFVTLNNLSDLLKRTRFNGTELFTNKTKALRKELDFINHMRNKSAGHLDPLLTERAAQWMPQIFSTVNSDNERYKEFRIFEAYRAVIESSINSYVSGEGRRKVFDHEIDLVYPPDQKEFYDFLHKKIHGSLEWLALAVEIIESAGIFDGQHSTAELACIAGQTNFDLKGASDFSYSEDKLRDAISSEIGRAAELSEDERANLIERLKSKI